MKTSFALVLLPLLACSALAQTNRVADDAKPATSNIPGAQYPKVDSQGRVYFRIHAPNANSVTVSLRGGNTLTKGDDGYWTGTTSPKAPGFHYYTISIDGVAVADPASESYFGTGINSSGIEIPSAGEDFYEAKDVPHGEIRARYYYVKTAHEWQTWRRSLHEFAPLLFQSN